MNLKCKIKVINTNVHSLHSTIQNLMLWQILVTIFWLLVSTHLVFPLSTLKNLENTWLASHYRRISLASLGRIRLVSQDSLTKQTAEGNKEMINYWLLNTQQSFSFPSFSVQFPSLAHLMCPTRFITPCALPACLQDYGAVLAKECRPQ